MRVLLQAQTLLALLFCNTNNTDSNINCHQCVCDLSISILTSISLSLWPSSTHTDFQVKKKRHKRILNTLLCCFRCKTSPSRGVSQENVSIKVQKNFHLLPTVRSQDANKICLVIDLDETLVHSSFKVSHGQTEDRSIAFYLLKPFVSPVSTHTHTNSPSTMRTLLSPWRLTVRRTKCTSSRGPLWMSFSRRWASSMNVFYLRPVWQRWVSSFSATCPPPPSLLSPQVSQSSSYFSAFNLITDTFFVLNSTPIQLPIFSIDGAFSRLASFENPVYFTMETMWRYFVLATYTCTDSNN